MDIQRLETILEEECGLNNCQPVLLGFSGGPDSLTLLDLFARSRYSCIAVHFDHQLREGSAFEAGIVRTQAENLKVPFLSGSADVISLAESKKLTLEEAARIARYTFLFQKARQVNAQAVAVAHTADDQVETVLMHLLRGAGMDGLPGMAYRSLPNEWDKQIPLIRPLLGVWREEILAYCEESRLTPVLDPSNQDVTFFRNRVRHRLIPELELYNPKIKQALWRMARILSSDAEVLEGVCKKAWEELLVYEAPGLVALDHQNMMKIPAGLQRRLMRKALMVLLPDGMDVPFETIERGRRFTSMPSASRHVELSGGVSLYLIHDRLVFTTSEENIPLDFWPQRNGIEMEAVNPPFEIPLNSGWILKGNLLPGPARLEKVGDENTAWIDAEKIRFPLVIRTWQPGDRFQPLGMESGSIKISDFWVNQKIPRLARKNWPLIISADQIVWIPGQRLAHFCRVTPQTGKLLCLELVRKNGR